MLLNFQLRVDAYYLTCTKQGCADIYPTIFTSMKIPVAAVFLLPQVTAIYISMHRLPKIVSISNNIQYQEYKQTPLNLIVTNINHCFPECAFHLRRPLLPKIYQVLNLVRGRRLCWGQSSGFTTSYLYNCLSLNTFLVSR